MKPHSETADTARSRSIEFAYEAVADIVGKCEIFVGVHVETLGLLQDTMSSSFCITELTAITRGKTKLQKFHCSFQNKQITVMFYIKTSSCN